LSRFVIRKEIQPFDQITLSIFDIVDRRLTLQPFVIKTPRFFRFASNQLIKRQIEMNTPISLTKLVNYDTFSFF